MGIHATRTAGTWRERSPVELASLDKNGLLHTSIAGNEAAPGREYRIYAARAETSPGLISRGHQDEQKHASVTQAPP